jgi:GT2 family glycosyltransferase
MDTGTFQMSTQYTNPGRNVSCPYVSGHFFFTEKEVIQTVPFTDNVTFTEEEPLMALRFFMAGYQLVTPQKVFVFHRYGRPDRKLFWEDFPERFNLNNIKSKEYFRDIVYGNIIDDTIPHKRSIAEYEEYAGIYFKEWRLEDRIIKGLPSAPPFKENPV